MKLALICGLLAGCAATQKPAPPTTASFTPLESAYQGAPRERLPVVALDEKELMAAPPFRAVGVLQVEGKETRQLKAFLDAVAEAGAQAGCDVLYQRDAFELGTRVPKPIIPG